MRAPRNATAQQERTDGGLGEDAVNRGSVQLRQRSERAPFTKPMRETWASNFKWPLKRNMSTYTKDRKGRVDKGYCYQFKPLTKLHLIYS